MLYKGFASSMCGNPKAFEAQVSKKKGEREKARGHQNSGFKESELCKVWPGGSGCRFRISACCLTRKPLLNLESGFKKTSAPEIQHLFSVVVHSYVCATHASVLFGETSKQVSQQRPITIEMFYLTARSAAIYSVWSCRARTCISSIELVLTACGVVEDCDCWSCRKGIGLSCLVS